MTIKEFRLLHISVLDGENEVYNGMSEDAPQELLDKQIKIEGMEDKILKTKKKKKCKKK